MTSNSLNDSMDRAVKHYSSLFKLPSYSRAISLQALVCILGSIFSIMLILFNSNGLIVGLTLGLSLLLLHPPFDFITSQVILQKNQLLDFRRTAAVSLVCMFTWFFFVLVGAGLTFVFGAIYWWVRLSLLGFSAVLILRLIVFQAIANSNFIRSAISALLHPILCLIPFVLAWSWIGFALNASLLVFVVIAIGTGFMASMVFLRAIDRVAKEALGISSFLLLNAFLLNWVLGLNTPMEEIFEGLGEEKTVEVTLVKFGSPNPKTIIAIPSVHPGPFKNLGSSALPSMLKTALEKKYGCVACVPHGLLGHEADLASQKQNHKLINHVVDSNAFTLTKDTASPFMIANNGVATACGQIFGDFGFISFSLSPLTTEDFPSEVGSFVRKEADKHKLKDISIVNAHNCIGNPVNVLQILDTLENAASECIDKAMNSKPCAFEIGSATVIPDITLDEGMGPGGITVLVVRTGTQVAAYVVIDGNNMVSGLRDKITSSLTELGVNVAEVFTTDTHLVNAMVLNGRGYHPVGEAIDQNRIINSVKLAVKKSLSNLEQVKETSYCNIKIPNVKVIGEKQLATLCNLVDKGARKAKRILVPIFGGSGFLLILMLFLLVR